MADSPRPRAGGTTPLHHLRSALRRVAWIDRWRRRRAARSPGRWLFKHKFVRWMYLPEVRRQLPFAFRAYARFCRAQWWLWRAGAWPAAIVGGESLLRTIRAVRRATGRPWAARLDLGREVVHVNLDDSRMLHVPWELLYDDTRDALLGAYLRPGDTFVDVGANHGTFAMRASRLVGAEGLVIAVEPQPRLAELVGRSLAETAPCPFRVHQLACGDRQGEVDLFIPKQTSGAAGIHRRFSGRFEHDRIRVPLARFDDLESWRDLPGRPFFKLDMEGSELAFLRGAGETLSRRPACIMLEMDKSSMLAAGTTTEALARELEAAGCARFVALGETAERPLSELDPGRFKYVVALPDEPAPAATRPPGDR